MDDAATSDLDDPSTPRSPSRLSRLSSHSRWHSGRHPQVPMLPDVANVSRRPDSEQEADDGERLQGTAPLLHGVEGDVAADDDDGNAPVFLAIAPVTKPRERGLRALIPKKLLSPRRDPRKVDRSAASKGSLSARNRSERQSTGGGRSTEASASAEKMRREIAQLKNENAKLKSQLDEANRRAEAAERRASRTSSLPGAAAPSAEPDTSGPLQEHRLAEPLAESAQELHRTQREQREAEEEQKAKDELKRDESENCCSFYFVPRDVVLAPLQEQRTTLPPFQELLKQGGLECRKLNVTEAYRSLYVGDTLGVSHRWEDKDAPDGMGDQLTAVREHLKLHTEVQWVCYWCMPQGERTPAERVRFKWMLEHVNLIYIGCRVLCLVDISYLSRFWTQFEAWLAMQVGSSDGLVSATGSRNRCTIRCLHNATEGMEDKKLRRMWGQVTLQLATDILSKPDVTVTNSGDKEIQLKQAQKLETAVREAWSVKVAASYRERGVTAEHLPIGFSPTVLLEAGFTKVEIEHALPSKFSGKHQAEIQRLRQEFGKAFDAMPPSDAAHAAECKHEFDDIVATRWSLLWAHVRILRTLRDSPRAAKQLMESPTSTARGESSLVQQVGHMLQARLGGLLGVFLRFATSLDLCSAATADSTTRGDGIDGDAWRALLCYECKWPEQMTKPQAGTADQIFHRVVEMRIRSEGFPAGRLVLHEFLQALLLLVAWIDEHWADVSASREPTAPAADPTKLAIVQTNTQSGRTRNILYLSGAAAPDGDGFYVDNTSGKMRRPGKTTLHVIKDADALRALETLGERDVSDDAVGKFTPTEGAQAVYVIEGRHYSAEVRAIAAAAAAASPAPPPRRAADGATGSAFVEALERVLDAMLPAAEDAGTPHLGRVLECRKEWVSDTSVAALKLHAVRALVGPMLFHLIGGVVDKGDDGLGASDGPAPLWPALAAFEHVVDAGGLSTLDASGKKMDARLIYMCSAALQDRLGPDAPEEQSVDVLTEAVVRLACRNGSEPCSLDSLAGVCAQLLAPWLEEIPELSDKKLAVLNGTVQSVAARPKRQRSVGRPEAQSERALGSSSKSLGRLAGTSKADGEASLSWLPQPPKKGEPTAWVRVHKGELKGEPLYQTKHTRNIERGVETWPYAEEDFATDAETGTPVKHDLCEMLHIDEPNILRALKNRHAGAQPYTRAGPNMILISVNPYRDLGLYTPEAVLRYRTSQSRDSPPHIFQVAADAYTRLQRDNKNQSIISSGESGAGKTENTKQIFFYLAQVAAVNSGEQRMEQQLIDSNDVLEAFGNAKTTRNDNSSRFGKLVDIVFNVSARMTGSKIRIYLLERPRVIGPAPGERNYHFFFQLLRGLPPEERDRRGLSTPEAYACLTTAAGGESGALLSIDGVDDGVEFRRTTDAMATLGIDEAVQQTIFDVVAAILHLSNIQIIQDTKASTDQHADSMRTAGGLAKIFDRTDGLPRAAELLGVPANQLQLAMTFTLAEDGRPFSRLSVGKATGLKRALAQELYSKLFELLVRRINAQTPPRGPLEISVLDIFGFEIFEVNSLEQLCINYCNERLQKNFTDTIFKVEQGRYMEEGVPFDRVGYVNNQQVIDLIAADLKHPENQEGGILQLLQKVIEVGDRASDLDLVRELKALPGKFRLENGSSPFQMLGKKDSGFKITHYAGEVKYSMDGLREKSVANLGSMAKLMRSSQMTLVQELFASSADAGAADARGAAGGGGEGAGGDRGGKAGGTGGSKVRVKVTVGQAFKRSLEGLINTLESTDTHYVRCIKPNGSRLASTSGELSYDETLVLEQLRYSGVFEAVEVRKRGYGFHKPHTQFIMQNLCLISDKSAREHFRRRVVSTRYGTPEFDRVKAKEICEEFIKVVQSGATPVDGLEDAPIGINFIFYRLKQERALEVSRFRACEEAQIFLAKLVRGNTSRQQLEALRTAQSEIVKAASVTDGERIEAATRGLALYLPPRVHHLKDICAELSQLILHVGSLAASSNEEKSAQELAALHVCIERVHRLQNELWLMHLSAEWFQRERLQRLSDGCKSSSRLKGPVLQVTAQHPGDGGSLKGHLDQLLRRVELEQRQLEQSTPRPVKAKDPSQLRTARLLLRLHTAMRTNDLEELRNGIGEDQSIAAEEGRPPLAVCTGSAQEQEEHLAKMWETEKLLLTEIECTRPWVEEDELTWHRESVHTDLRSLTKVQALMTKTKRGEQMLAWLPLIKRCREVVVKCGPSDPPSFEPVAQLLMAKSPKSSADPRSFWQELKEVEAELRRKHPEWAPSDCTAGDLVFIELCAAAEEVFHVAMQATMGIQQAASDAMSQPPQSSRSSRNSRSSKSGVLSVMKQSSYRGLLGAVPPPLAKKNSSKGGSGRLSARFSKRAKTGLSFGEAAGMPRALPSGVTYNQSTINKLAAAVQHTAEVIVSQKLLQVDGRSAIADGAAMMTRIRALRTLVHGIKQCRQGLSSGGSDLLLKASCVVELHDLLDKVDWQAALQASRPKGKRPSEWSEAGSHLHAQFPFGDVSRLEAQLPGDSSDGPPGESAAYIMVAQALRRARMARELCSKLSNASWSDETSWDDVKEVLDSAERRQKQGVQADARDARTPETTAARAEMELAHAFFRRPQQLLGFLDRVDWVHALKACRGEREADRMLATKLPLAGLEAEYEKLSKTLPRHYRVEDWCDPGLLSRVRVVKRLLADLRSCSWHSAESWETLEKTVRPLSITKPKDFPEVKAVVAELEALRSAKQNVHTLKLKFEEHRQRLDKGFEALPGLRGRPHSDHFSISEVFPHLHTKEASDYEEAWLREVHSMRDASAEFREYAHKTPLRSDGILQMSTGIECAHLLLDKLSVVSWSNPRTWEDLTTFLKTTTGGGDRLAEQYLNRANDECNLMETLRMRADELVEGMRSGLDDSHDNPMSSDATTSWVDRLRVDGHQAGRDIWNQLHREGGPFKLLDELTHSPYQPPDGAATMRRVEIARELLQELLQCDPDPSTAGLGSQWHRLDECIKTHRVPETTPEVEACHEALDWMRHRLEDRLEDLLKNCDGQSIVEHVRNVGELRQLVSVIQSFPVKLSDRSRNLMKVVEVIDEMVHAMERQSAEESAAVEQAAKLNQLLQTHHATLERPECSFIAQDAKLFLCTLVRTQLEHIYNDLDDDAKRNHNDKDAIARFEKIRRVPLPDQDLTEALEKLHVYTDALGRPLPRAPRRLFGLVRARADKVLAREEERSAQERARQSLIDATKDAGGTLYSKLRLREMAFEERQRKAAEEAQIARAQADAAKADAERQKAEALKKSIELQEQALQKSKAEREEKAAVAKAKMLEAEQAREEVKAKIVADERAKAEAEALAKQAEADRAQAENDMAVEATKTAELAKAAEEAKLQAAQDEIKAAEEKKKVAEDAEQLLMQIQNMNQMPQYWAKDRAPLAKTGFALHALDGEDKDQATWSILQGLLDTDGEKLGFGPDHKSKSDSYKKFKVARAWRLEHPTLWQSYTSGRGKVLRDMQVLRRAKIERNGGNALLTADLSQKLPGGVMDEVNEHFLVHGTSPLFLFDILSAGLNERFSGSNAGTAYGDGTYFAEDPGKCDQYVQPDNGCDEKLAKLHEQLYDLADVTHPGKKTYYLLVCRVAVGHYIRTHTPGRAAKSVDQPNLAVFPKGFRELAPVPGGGAIYHHSLLADVVGPPINARYREVVVFHSDYVYPEYVIAYHRIGESGASV